MAIEARRGCGFREAGGKYLVGPPPNAPCCRLPSPIVPCPTCGHEVGEQARGWAWHNPDLLMAGSKPTCEDFGRAFGDCPLFNPSASYGKKVALLWVGERYYTPESFLEEAATMGVSKKIAAIPMGFDVRNPPWVFLAHPYACAKGHEHRWRIHRSRMSWTDWQVCPEPEAEGIHAFRDEHLVALNQWGGRGLLDANRLRWEHRMVKAPGIFMVFKPRAIEYVATTSMLKQRKTRKLARLGVQIVEVPDGDPDHDPRGAARELRRRKRAMARGEPIAPSNVPVHSNNTIDLSQEALDQ